MKKIIASLFIFSFLFAGVASAASTSWQTWDGKTLTVYKSDSKFSGICYFGKAWEYNGKCVTPAAAPHLYLVNESIKNYEARGETAYANQLRKQHGIK